MPAPTPILEQQAEAVIAITPLDTTQATGVRILDGDGNLISSSNGLAVKQVNDSINPIEYFSEYVRNVGSNDLGIDGSGGDVSFSVTPSLGKDLEISRILLYMEASGNFVSTSFMNLAALTNGVQIKADGTILTTWKDNIDIICDMFDLSNAGTAFSNERRSLAGRWTYTKGTGGESLLIPNGKLFEVLIRDDLSAAGIIFRVKVQGHLMNS